MFMSWTCCLKRAWETCVEVICVFAMSLEREILTGRGGLLLYSLPFGGILGCMRIRSNLIPWQKAVFLESPE